MDYSVFKGIGLYQRDKKLNTNSPYLSAYWIKSIQFGGKIQESPLKRPALTGKFD